jgi:5-methylcytosine-specific restriction enzyme subunit McrC
MALLRREEREPIRIGTGLDEISPEDLRRIETQWRSKSGKPPSVIFDYGFGTVRPKNWTGVIATRTTSLEVVPRGAGALPAESRRLLDRNLGQMLQLAALPEGQSISLASLSAAASWSERAVEAYCDAVLIARRKSVLRTYRARNEASQSARGRLVFPDHDLYQITHPAYFFSHWVELDQDRAENRFLKAVLQYCAQRTGGRVGRRVQEVVAEFDRVPDTADPNSEHRQIRFERLSREYSHAIQLGDDLLKRQIGGYFIGSVFDQSQILFMPDLFEAFVTRLVRQVVVQNQCTLLAKPRGDFLGQWQSGPRAGARSFEIVPDMEVRRMGTQRPLLLLDAKWKTLQPLTRNLGITEDDVYQVLAYAHHRGCEHVVLLYPWMGHTTPFDADPIALTLHKGPMTLAIGCLPLLWKNVANALDCVRRIVESQIHKQGPL